MNTFLFMLASTAVGWLLGSRTSQRQIDQRFDELERRMAPVPAAPPPEPVIAPPVEAPQEELDEETLLILSAAIAAFLGKKARIRRVKRLSQPGFNPWSQQGRVNIMGSHDVRHHA